MNEKSEPENVTAPARMKPMQWFLRVLEGALIGGGAILPGISGGVLCVSFGLYQPLMALLAHPKSSLRIYGRLFIPVVIGWVLGFWGFALVVDLLFGASDVVATWLFIGLIAGTIPSLFKEAAKERRARAADWAALAAGFVLMAAFLVGVQVGFSASLKPGIGWFFGLIAALTWTYLAFFSLLAGIKVTRGNPYQYRANTRLFSKLTSRNK